MKMWSLNKLIIFLVIYIQVIYGAHITSNYTAAVKHGDIYHFNSAAIDMLGYTKISQSMINGTDVVLFYMNQSISKRPDGVTLSQCENFHDLDLKTRNKLIFNIAINFQGCFNLGIYAYLAVCLMNFYAYMLEASRGYKENHCFLHENIASYHDTSKILLDLSYEKDKDHVHMIFIKAFLNGFCSKQYENEAELQKLKPSCLIHVTDSVAKIGIYSSELRGELFDLMQRETLKLVNLSPTIYNLDAKAKKNVMIYNRHDAMNYRWLLNSHEVVSQLQKTLPNYNFIEINAIPKNLNDTIKLFASAHVFIGPHGGWLPNLMFARKDGIAMILQNSYIKPAFNVWDRHFRTAVLTVVDVRPLKKGFHPPDSHELLHCELEYDGSNILKSNVTLRDPTCISKYLTTPPLLSIY